jgi:hypothetical protein
MNKPRLIDANALLKDLYYYFGKEKWAYSSGCLIKDQPTAYDIQGVVERLEKEKGIAFMTLANTGNKEYDAIYHNVVAYMEKAIEIVKDQFRDNTKMVDRKGGAE